MIEYIAGGQYTIPYKILINKDKSYNPKCLDLLRKFTWYNDIVILLPSEVSMKDAENLVKYLKSMKIRSPQYTYIVYTPLISDIDELEVLVESM